MPPILTPPMASASNNSFNHNVRSFRVIICSVTDAEKLADYEIVMQIINDALALEKHFAKEGRPFETIEFLRADAYKSIVDRVFGPDTLHQLEVERNRARVA